MATQRNPKQVDTPLWDCIPQTGLCPNDCNQCYFNRPGAYYVPLEELPLIPTPEEVGNDIVRMNCGHDSNIEFEKVVATASQYQHVFFNTSLPNLAHFPGPVVFTANPREEKLAHLISPPDNLMFVRLRVSGTNLNLIDHAVEHYTASFLWSMPVVLTMMAYYDHAPDIDENQVNEFGANLTADECYNWRVRHINSYWCPTPAFMKAVMDRYVNNRLVTLCGGLRSNFCRNCRNCETYYLQTKKRLRGE